MPIAKSNGAVADKPTVSQTAPAPVSRTLTPPVGEVNDSPKAKYQGRDFDAEARGKVACASYAAALASPGLAGLSFSTPEEYLTLVKKAADEMVKYTWEHQK